MPYIELTKETNSIYVTKKINHSQRRDLPLPIVLPSTAMKSTREIINTMLTNMLILLLPIVIEICLSFKNFNV